MRKPSAKPLARLLALGLSVGLSLGIAAAPALANDGVNAMHRLYNPNSGEHFYTSSAVERDHLTSVGWSYEGIGWFAPSQGDPVFRLYNSFAGDHHYTTSNVERDHLKSIGWNDEGVGWCSGGDVALYRQYNPYASAGAHNYTTSPDENDMLTSIGWRDEGIAWYGVSEGVPVAAPNASAEGGVTDSGYPEIVYVTATGSKFHRAGGCRSTARSSLTPMSLSDALAHNLGPCKNCFH